MTNPSSVPVKLAGPKVLATVPKIVVARSRRCRSARPTPSVIGCWNSSFRAMSVDLTYRSSVPGWSTRASIEVHTSPSDGFSGCLGSPRMPSTTLSIELVGFLLRPKSRIVGVPCPGMNAPLASMTVCTSTDGRKFSTRGAPNSRFIKLLPVIFPTNPARRRPSSSGMRASSKKRSMNGTVSTYLPWQLAYRVR